MLREITCLLFIYFFKRGKCLHRLFSSKRVKQRWEVQRRELLSQLQFCCAAKCWTVGATFAHQCAVNMSLSQDGQRWWPHWPSTVFVFLLKSHLIKLASKISGLNSWQPIFKSLYLNHSPESISPLKTTILWRWLLLCRPVCPLHPKLTIHSWNQPDEPVSNS